MKNSLYSYLQIVVFTFSFIAVAPVVFAQKVVSGNLQHQSNQELRLVGFSGLDTITLAVDTIDASGDFNLSYQNYNGMGYLATSEESQFYMVLNEPDITIKGSHLKDTDSIKFSNSSENLLFNQYAVEHNQREQVLLGWKYLLSKYQQVELLKTQNQYIDVINKEINRLEQQDKDFLNQIPEEKYVSWFLPMRKLLEDIPLSVRRFTERIPQHIADFRNIDFNSSELYHSGILADLIKSHYWLIENSGKSMDEMYDQMNSSTNSIIKSLNDNEKKLNEVGNFLFHLFEKRSLFKASEHLSLKLLTQSSCTLEDDFAKQLESYRAMKVGNTAPNIEFKGKKMVKGKEVRKKLDLTSFETDYTLVVFGSSWCPSCVQEIPKIKEKYVQWKMKSLETVFISLDTDHEKFSEFVQDFPFLSTCDFKGWDSKAVQDYYVFATPTLFLLNKEREIVLRPSSIEQVDAWVKYKLNSKN